MSLAERRENIWSGFKWNDIVQTYEDIYTKWQTDESIEPPVDCPLDDLLPAMLESLPPKLKSIWNKSDKLKVIKYLPDNTNLYTAISIRSFEEFYKLFLYINEGKYENTISM